MNYHSIKYTKYTYLHDGFHQNTQNPYYKHRFR